MKARIILMSGPCGTGKSTLSRLLAERSAYPGAVHLHTDDFYQYIRKGYIDPWKEEAGDQNEVVINTVVAAAEELLKGGYEVYVDGVIGPWFLMPWLRLAEEGHDIRYVVLRPSEESTVLRAFQREQRAEFPLTGEVIRHMWQSFSRMGDYESHALDTTGQSVSESAAVLQTLLNTDAFRLGKHSDSGKQ